MKKLGWIFFVMSIFLAGYLFHFYYFVYIPTKAEADALKRENVILRDSLLRNFSVPRVQEEKKQPEVSYRELKYPQGDFFIRNSANLSEKGIEALNKLKENLQGFEFDSLLVILYPEGGNLSTQRALKVKSYLVSLGFDEKKLFAMVTKTGEKGAILIRIR